MGVIAKQLGHADTQMTEKHYAHLAPNYVADTIRANFPRLGITADPLPVVPFNGDFKTELGENKQPPIVPATKKGPVVMA